MTNLTFSKKPYYLFTCFKIIQGKIHESTRFFYHLPPGTHVYKHSHESHQNFQTHACLQNKRTEREIMNRELVGQLLQILNDQADESALGEAGIVILCLHFPQDRLMLHEASIHRKPDIYIPNHEEEEMKRILVVSGLLSIIRSRPVPEIVLTQNLLVGADLQEHQRAHSMQSPYQRRISWTPQIRTRHQIPTRTLIPRGICRDLHGRPEQTRPIRSRLAKRNGSR